MEKFNLDKLVKISVLKREKSTMYKYKKHQKKTWFQPEIQEGVHKDFFGSKYVDIDSVNSIVVVDFVVYVKDRVVLSFESNITHVAFCDTPELARQYADNIDTASKGNFLKTYSK